MFKNTEGIEIAFKILSLVSDLLPMGCKRKLTKCMRWRLKVKFLWLKCFLIDFYLLCVKHSVNGLTFNWITLSTTPSPPSSSSSWKFKVNIKVSNSIIARKLNKFIYRIKKLSLFLFTRHYHRQTFLSSFPSLSR